MSCNDVDTSNPMDPFAMTRLSRGELLRRASVAAMSVGLISPALASAARVSGWQSGAVRGSIDFLGWEGYDLLGITAAEQWEKANDVKLNATYINGSPEIIAKLQAKAVSWDVSAVANSLIGRFHQLKLIQPIANGRIQGTSNVFPSLADPKVFRDSKGNWKAIPFTWLQSYSNYRPDKVPRPTSWLDLMKPEFKGKVGWAGGPDGAILIAGRMIGAKNNPWFTPAEWKEVLAFLRKMRTQVKAVGITYGDLTELLVSGDVWLSFNGWSAVDGFAKAKGTVVKGTLPKEGGVTYVDSFALPTGADNAEAGLAFMNLALNPAVQAAFGEKYNSGVVVRGAIPLLSRAARRSLPYSNLAATLKRAPVILNPPDKTTKKVIGYETWLDEWAKLKAGA